MSVTLSIMFSSAAMARDRIYLLAGQSNMMGLAGTEGLPAAYKSTPPNVVFYYKGGARPLARDKHIGPEVSFAHAVARAFPADRHIIVKFAATGSHIRQWFPGEHYYKGLLRQLELAVSPETPEIEAIFWMQGEGDAFNKERASQYATNLTHFIRHLRQDLRAAGAPFIMGLIDPIGRDFPEVALVQQNQRLVNSTVANTYLLPAEGISKIYDNIHFDALGQVEMGKRFAQQYIEIAGRK
ncbi:MAG: sialate O-acetylesterase [Thiolinea sp.]